MDVASARLSINNSARIQTQEQSVTPNIKPLKPSVRLIKPVRRDKNIVDFNISNNMISNGWCLDILLDLNVITRMEECIFNNKSLDDVGLSSFVNFISSQRVIISPGLAIREVNREYSERAREGYLNFIKKYLPNYIDTPASTWTPESDALNRMNYEEEAESFREALYYFYGAMLLLCVVDKIEKLNPLDKFSLYLEKLAETTGIVGALEARVAQFFFYDRSRLPEGEGVFKTYCREIRENFLKSGSSRKKIKLNAKNYAQDIYLFRAAAIRQGKEYKDEGARTDMWIASGDVGLMNIGSSFYFDQGEDGKWTGGFMPIDLFPEMQIDPYWKLTETYFGEVLERRQDARNRGANLDITFQEAEVKISKIESNFKE
jgi:hypothetical protein